MWEDLFRSGFSFPCVVLAASDLFGVYIFVCVCPCRLPVSLCASELGLALLVLLNMYTPSSVNLVLKLTRE